MCKVPRQPVFSFPENPPWCIFSFYCIAVLSTAVFFGNSRAFFSSFHLSLSTCAVTVSSKQRWSSATWHSITCVGSQILWLRFSSYWHHCWNKCIPTGFTWQAFKKKGYQVTPCPNFYLFYLIFQLFIILNFVSANNFHAAAEKNRWQCYEHDHFSTDIFSSHIILFLIHDFFLFTISASFLHSPSQILLAAFSSF